MTRAWRSLSERLNDLVAIGQAEPIIRWSVIAVAAAFLLAVGWGVVEWSWRGYATLRQGWLVREFVETPRKMTVYAVGSDCIRFAGLPAGWSAGKQYLDGKGFSIGRGAGDGRVSAGLSLRGDHPFDNPWAEQIGGQRALEAVQVDGFTAWVGDEQYTYADGDKDSYRRSMICHDPLHSPKSVTDMICEASDRGFPGKYDVFVTFPWRGGSEANRLIDEAEAALKTVFIACPTAATESPRPNFP